MQQVLQYFVIIPIAVFFASLLVPRKNERLLFSLMMAATGVQLLGISAFVLQWLMLGRPDLELRWLELYSSPNFEFVITFLFDRITAVFALVGALLTFLVAIFSRYYMHRDPGFKRFFTTLAIFYAGYNLVVFSGNFETLFSGWELLGITSFLLIAFYRDRYLPVKNGFKVLSFYRLGDICLILAMWMSHHFWHKNIAFSELNALEWVQSHIDGHYLEAGFISIMIILAAAIKSAQAPFSTWLPRAMEGPTASSAIFYGSLAVHIGVFVLLRTFNFWGHDPVFQGLVISFGLATALIATSISRVQPTVKTQIAYASIAQIGIMFIEVALGFHLLALLHFAGNACLRTYQLLVSPSVLSYLVHDMFFSFKPRANSNAAAWVTKWRNAFYVLSIKEWNFDFWMHRYAWSPFKWLGKQLNFLNLRSGSIFGLIMVLAGLAAMSFKTEIGEQVYAIVPTLFAILALLAVLKGFSEREDAKTAWMFAVFSQLCVAIAITSNQGVEWSTTVLYLSGGLLAAVTGYLCLNKIQQLEQTRSLNAYHGHSHEYPQLAALFLLSCLGLAGFPITPTFLGIDLMLTHIPAHHVFLAVLIALNLLFLELTLIRIYCRIFLGLHKKEYHPVAFKSS